MAVRGQHLLLSLRSSFPILLLIPYNLLRSVWSLIVVCVELRSQERPPYTALVGTLSKRIYRIQSSGTTTGTRMTTTRSSSLVVVLSYPFDNRFLYSKPLPIDRRQLQKMPAKRLPINSVVYMVSTHQTTNS
jgi:hypothetical protein